MALLAHLSCSKAPPSEDQLAWEAACDAVRVRLKYPVEAQFPSQPRTEIQRPNVISLRDSIYELEALRAESARLSGDDEKYYTWRREALERVEMLREPKRWTIAGWVDAPNAMGVRDRLAWYSVVRRDGKGGGTTVEKVKLLGTD